MKQKLCYKVVLFILLSCSLFLSGCKTDPALDTYKANMNQFFENIKVFDSAINSIDPNADTAVKDLLYLLDSMETSFTQMASLDVPDNFHGVEQLADEASTYMTEAVMCYHQAFEGDSYNENIAAAAKENYDRANLRIQYIISILHGEIPEDIYVYDEE